MDTNASIQTKPTVRAVAPAPYGVKLAPAEHTRLIVKMVAGRSPEATRDERLSALSARNAVIVAYMPLIERESTRTSANAQASEDRSAEAYLRCLEAIGTYDPALGVPLGTYLRRSHAMHGEAVARAGMPQDLAGRDQRRDLNRRGLPIPRPTSLNAAIAGRADSLLLQDLAPSTEPGPEELAVAADMKKQILVGLSRLTRDQRTILGEHFGLDGYPMSTMRELALARGLTVGGVQYRLGRALTALAETAPHLRTFLET
ncbi:sigma-70 family RNA polymerase sigma factor [Cryobacterium sp. 5I3]|uniref:sigma-70 family RNA polymerase sigma factor n=2 Tax=unclassified Cryobacterium TaxID=2649013 RepID=UPI002B23DA8D|nr:sigma-70 family RNA polymerase sigma factor [Cryobacterium sp. 5I3]MEB0203725.1 sigma-70 family RNA polymerase sigma factor [Cryobacterium sp. 5I3]